MIDFQVHRSSTVLLTTPLYHNGTFLLLLVVNGLGFWLSGTGMEPLGPEVALPLTAAAVLVLGVAIWIGFLVMARRSAWPLSGLYLLTNAALLVPTRDTAPISTLLLLLALGLAGLVVWLRRRDPSLATPEGLFARCVLAYFVVAMRVKKEQGYSNTVFVMLLLRAGRTH